MNPIPFHLTAKGVLLFVEQLPPSDAVAVEVVAQVFADVVEDGVAQRWFSTRCAGDVDLTPGADPTDALTELVDNSKVSLEDLLYEIRRGGDMMTRWEFYSAPTLVELSDDLRELLRTRWKEHEP